MNEEEVEKFFEDHNDEFLKFDRIKEKRSGRSDLHAFLLLDELFPGSSDMVCSAEHDEIWLDVEAGQLGEKASGAQLVELIRCGVRIDDGYLAMFV
jgi:hypothetical protein